MKHLLTGALLALLFSHSAVAQQGLLNDEFSDPSTLSDWTSISDAEGWDAEHLEEFDINTSRPDQLYMMPYTSTWYQDYKGVLLFKTISGDFTFTTELTATNRAGDGPPSSDFSLAGLMIRPPRDFDNGADGWTAGNENYVFHAAGAASGTPPQLEIKTTQNSNSNLQVSAIGTLTNLQLRVARLGRYIICLAREPGGDWMVRRRLDRADFPDELQAGFTTYTNYSKASSYTPIFQNSHVLNEDLDPDPGNNAPFNPQLIGAFGFARYTDVALPPELADEDLTDPSVSDEDLLAFLGFDSEPYVAGVTLETNVLLAGPFGTGGMDTSLNPLLPLSQPFGDAPWSYAGTESVASMSDGTVDWVLVELRTDPASPSTVRRAGLLQRDGSITDLDGSSPLRFPGTAPGSYHVVVRQQNHLAVISRSSVSLVGN